MDNKNSEAQRKAPIQSVERAINILECFENSEQLSLSEIGKALGLHKSTTFGLVSTLETYRLVEKDPISRKYRLGIELFRLGNKVNVDIRSIVAPYLDKLVSTYCETANFVIFDKDSIVYMEKKESPYSMRIATVLGQREPLYRTATGKSILSCLPLETAKSILEQTEFEQRTDKTLLSAKAVLEELNSIRENGYAIDNEELEQGVICVGAALMDSTNEPVGAISVSGPSTRMDLKKQRAIAEELVAYTKQINRQL